MGKIAGFFKKIKNGIKNVGSKIGKGVNKFLTSDVGNFLVNGFEKYNRLQNFASGLLGELGGLIPGFGKILSPIGKLHSWFAGKAADVAKQYLEDHPQDHKLKDDVVELGKDIVDKYPDLKNLLPEVMLWTWQ